MNRSHYTRRMGKQRRGLSTPVMLMGVMSALLFIVLTIDLAQLSLQRQEMQVGADAATIAAVPELMDRRWLYLGPEGGSQSPQAIVAWTDSLPEQQAAAALAQAQLFAASNQVASQPIELEEECVAFGYVSDPTSGNPDMEPPGTVDHYNSIGIEIKRSKLSKNPPVLWLARQTGLDSIDVLVRSQACVDTRIHGFKPLDHVNVPLVPLGLFKYRGEGANSHSSGSSSASGYPGGSENMPAQIWWAKGPQDSFTVNPKTGDVIGQSDGIAEMIFRVKFKQQSQSGNNEQHNNEDARPSAWLGFHDGHFDTEQFARLSFIGAHAGDFAAYGGKLTLGDEIPPLVSAQFRLSQGELSDFHQVFQSGHLRGKPRLWPVVADCSSAVGEPTVGIIGFVAGCVVDTGSDADGSLLVTIQPCLMQTPTALTGAVAQRNPWIGKLLLVR